ncbi:peptidoglycan DD-metalloendopeptidase family protein [Canibacter zhoujuaniae]|uniref:peptidoglycan DD-metalloendopeptidase family protein n=1 Tax=Canibacter zhoujuaniae TaxID=2708343 RepID=UPI00141F2BCA|nr:M23 family metallopeptidase [Canibacter zhoujuaniae]
MKHTGKRLRATRLIAIGAGAALLGATLNIAPNTHTISAAFALDLPTWSDVEAAKQDEAATAAKIAEVEKLLGQVRTEVESAQSAAEVASQIAMTAQSEFETADQRQQALYGQVEEKRAEANRAADAAANVVAEMYRSGGVDRSMEFFLEGDPDASDALLERLAMMSKATERNTRVAQEATRAQLTVADLQRQAEEAAVKRQELYEVAQGEFEAAASAVEAARQRQQTAETNQRVLETQLAALKDKTAETVAGYQERLRIEEEQRRKAEEEARRRAAEEAERARRAAAEAARQEAARQEAARKAAASQWQAPAPAPRPAPPAPVVSGNWTAPLTPGSYSVSCPWRCYPGHNGHDMATSPWTPIYAAGAGVVIAAGYTGINGNYVFIDHGNGVHTWYAHMVQAPSVSYGQWVGPGQIIGYVGSTGLATGPHLHFEVRIWGTPTPADGFMAQQGIYI